MSQVGSWIQSQFLVHIKIGGNSFRILLNRYLMNKGGGLVLSPPAQVRATYVIERQNSLDGVQRCGGG